MAVTSEDELRVDPAPAWRDDGAQRAPQNPPQGPQPGVAAALRRYRWSSVAVVTAFVALSAAVGLATGPSSAAVARVELTTPGSTSLLSPGGTSDAVVARYTAQRAAFATSDRVLGRVAQRTGTPVPELRRSVAVTTTEGTNSLTVSVDAGGSSASVEVADAVVQAYRQQARAEVDRLTVAALAAIEVGAVELRAQLVERRAGAAAQSAATTLSSLEQQANALSTERAVFGDGVQFVTAAVPDDAPGLPLRELALGLVVGLGLAAVVAWLRADRDRRVEDGAGAAAALGAPLLGEVPAVDDLDDGSAALEGLPSVPYRPVVPVLSLRSSSGVVLVTSARGAEGRTQTALNLAVSGAREGLRVLLVDADVGTGDASRTCGAPPDLLGVSDLVVAGVAAWSSDLARTVRVGRGATMSLLPAGVHPGDGAGAQLSLAAQVLGAVRESYDLVVVDAAPLPTGGLPAVLARLADQVLVVARQGSPLDEAVRLRELLSLLGTPVVGVLLTFSSGRQHRGAARRPGGVIVLPPTPAVPSAPAAGNGDRSAGRS